MPGKPTTPPPCDPQVNASGRLKHSGLDTYERHRRAAQDDTRPAGGLLPAAPAPSLGSPARPGFIAGSSSRPDQQPCVCSMEKGGPGHPTGTSGDMHRAHSHFTAQSELPPGLLTQGPFGATRPGALREQTWDKAARPLSSGERARPGHILCPAQRPRRCRRGRGPDHVGQAGLAQAVTARRHPHAVQ